MPKTFIRYFYLGVGLRSIMDAVSWPSTRAYQDMMQVFRDTFNGQDMQPSEDILSSLISPDDSTPPQRRKGRVRRNLDLDVYATLLELVNRTSSSSFASINDGVLGDRPYLPDAVEYVRSIQHDIGSFDEYLDHRTLSLFCCP